jgi:hypothetical protein
MSASAPSGGPIDRGVSAGGSSGSASALSAPPSAPGLRRSGHGGSGSSSVGYISVVEAAMRSVGVDPEACDPLVVAALMECSRRKRIVLYNL